MINGNLIVLSPVQFIIAIPNDDWIWEINLTIGFKYYGSWNRTNKIYFGI